MIEYLEKFCCDCLFYEHDNGTLRCKSPHLVDPVTGHPKGHELCRDERNNGKKDSLCKHHGVYWVSRAGEVVQTLEEPKRAGGIIIPKAELEGSAKMAHTGSKEKTNG